MNAVLSQEPGYPVTPDLKDEGALAPPASQPDDRKTAQAIRLRWALLKRNRRLPRIIYGAAGFFIVVLWGVLTLVFADKNENYQRDNERGGDKKRWGVNRPNFGGRTLPDYKLYLLGQLIKFSPSEKRLSVEWSGIMNNTSIEQDMSPEYDIHLGESGASFWPIDLYQECITVSDDANGGLNSTFEAIFEQNNGTLPYTWYSIRQPVPPRSGIIGVSADNAVPIDITMVQASTNSWTEPNFGYPWDIFQGAITLIAVDNATATARNQRGSGVIPILDVILAGSILNWDIKLSFNNTCLSSEDDPDACEAKITITARRTVLVKFCVVLAVIVSWTLTLGIFLVTGETVFLKRTHVIEGSDILGICLTALFALPSVRSLLPGAPDYGCLLDLVGILPNVITVALCTTVFAFAKLRDRFLEHEVLKLEAANHKDEVN